jgi:hypothetical protein
VRRHDQVHVEEEATTLVGPSFGSPLGPEFAVYDSASPSARTAPGALGETCSLVFYLKTGSHSFVEYDMQP